MSATGPHEFFAQFLGQFGAQAVRKPDLVYEMQARVNALREEIATLRREMKQREAAAYEDGLGAAARVYRENKMLAAVVAGLIDPRHEMNVS